MVILTVAIFLKTIDNISQMCYNIHVIKSTALKKKGRKIMRKYLMSSERADRRSDERDNVFETAQELKVGDVFIFDGLRWFVTAVL